MIVHDFNWTFDKAVDTALDGFQTVNQEPQGPQHQQLEFANAKNLYYLISDRTPNLYV